VRQLGCMEWGHVTNTMSTKWNATPNVYSSVGQISKGKASRYRSNNPWLKGYSKVGKALWIWWPFCVTQDILTKTSLVFRIMCGDGEAIPLLRYFGTLRPPLWTQFPQNGWQHTCPFVKQLNRIWTENRL
jgi:hypothetical protein